jgi:hypothetical protein
MISAAANQLIFFAIAFNSTSCTFIIRSISAAEYCRPDSSTLQAPVSAPFFQSGQIMR